MHGLCVLFRHCSRHISCSGALHVCVLCEKETATLAVLCREAQLDCTCWVLLLKLNLMPLQQAGGFACAAQWWPSTVFQMQVCSCFGSCPPGVGWLCSTVQQLSVDCLAQVGSGSCGSPVAGDPAGWGVHTNTVTSRCWELFMVTQQLLFVVGACVTQHHGDHRFDALPPSLLV